MKKRTIEVFTAGCPTCDDAVKLVQSIIVQAATFRFSTCAAIGRRRRRPSSTASSASRRWWSAEESPTVARWEAPRPPP